MSAADTGGVQTSTTATPGAAICAACGRPLSEHFYGGKCRGCDCGANLAVARGRHWADCAFRGASFVRREAAGVT